MDTNVIIFDLQLKIEDLKVELESKESELSRLKLSIQGHIYDINNVLYHMKDCL